MPLIKFLLTHAGLLYLHKTGNENSLTTVLAFFYLIEKCKKIRENDDSSKERTNVYNNGHTQTRMMNEVLFMGVCHKESTIRKRKRYVM